MNDPIVQFQNVSKRFAFTRDEPHTVLEKLVSVVSRRSRPRGDDDLWALRDVSFDVMPGQCLGIIGRNGSGKSTILKLITRILRPTSGRIVVRGRVSALLELGAGFHQDLTGRENIYLNGAVLGLDRETIQSRFNDIVAFSELGDFINMPVKHYSSGMYMRLGFSVAIHVNPDILIVDEILAVGDRAFQAKCIDSIYDLKEQGTTIVMVSHNLNMMLNLCSHLVWVEHGVVRAVGEANNVAGQYVAFSHGQQARQYRLETEQASFKRWGSGDIEIVAVRFLDECGREQKAFRTGDSMTVEMAYQAHAPITNPEFGMAIYRQDGVYVSRPNSHAAGFDMGVVQGQGVVRYHIDHLPLLPAQYKMTAAVYNSRNQQAYDHHDKAYSFHVLPGGTQELYGIVELPARWERQPVDSGVKAR